MELPRTIAPSFGNFELPAVVRTAGNTLISIIFTTTRGIDFPTQFLLRSV